MVYIRWGGVIIYHLPISGVYWPFLLVPLCSRVEGWVVSRLWHFAIYRVSNLTSTLCSCFLARFESVQNISLGLKLMLQRW